MSKPTRPTASDFDPQALRLFDDYVHGVIDRRSFLQRAATLAAGAQGALALLAALSPDFAAAQQIAPDDGRLATRHVEFESPQGHGAGRGYLVQPAGTTGKLPQVLVIHENRGLNPHIEDITRRLALEGFQAFAPDALAPLGGYPGSEDAARELFGKLDQGKTREDFLAAVRHLRVLPEATGTFGAVGFCYGGAVVNFLATRVPELVAGAPFYGSPAPLEDVAKIEAELLVVLAADDERVNTAWPEYKAALEAAGKTFTLFQPAGTVHGFNNDTTPRYNEAAAKEAWSRTLELFSRRLRT